MIHHLDNLLRHLFLAQIAEITSEGQVGFQPPDEEWRGHVTNLPQNALNVYLVDLRENRQLRSNERVRAFQNGIVSETPAPRRVDCQYLITAWSPADFTPAVEPTLDEHALLAEVTGVLMRHESLIPREVYAPDPLPATFPPEVADAELPTAVLPVEGFAKLAEFWGAMGANHRWKPAVYLVVTIPVLLRAEIAGPMVTTRVTEYRQTGKPETAEVWIQIGGHVLSSPLPPDNTSQPVHGAWVRLETLTGEALQTTETDPAGRFTFGALRGGRYRVRTRATGLGEISRDVDVPSPSGEYDLRFT
jgi:Pvc16 N-terminal domain/Carboxypeptidase regulatory-like domain